LSAPEESGRGAGTRARILRSALALAGVEGLEALTIGKLAGALSLSKAGLFGHFGSKEELQLATLEAAGMDFTQQVVLPAAQREAGLPRLLGLLEGWFEYADRQPGGCFFASTAAEFDGRRGPVHERVAHLIGQWWNLLTQLIEEAQRLGQLSPEPLPHELCLELYGIELAANLSRQLLGNADAMRVGLARARARLLREASALGRAALAPAAAAPVSTRAVTGQERARREPRSEAQRAASKARRNNRRRS
jgi:AcrR family transcriptional regulator